MTKQELMDSYGCRIIVDGTPVNRAIRTKTEMDNVILQSLTKNSMIQHSMECSGMDQAWKNRIKDKWWFKKEREEGHDQRMYALRETLLSFSGEAVLLPDVEEDAADLIKYGQFWPGYAPIMKKGSPNQCHANSAALWFYNQNVLKLCTGYALSDDGMWRQHSWCIWKKPRSLKIVETTAERVVYYGFVMDDAQAMRFYEEN